MRGIMIALVALVITFAGALPVSAQHPASDFFRADRAQSTPAPEVGATGALPGEVVHRGNSSDRTQPRYGKFVPVTVLGSHRSMECWQIPGSKPGVYHTMEVEGRDIALCRGTDMPTVIRTTTGERVHVVGVRMRDRERFVAMPANESFRDRSCRFTPVDIKCSG